MRLNKKPHTQKQQRHLFDIPSAVLRQSRAALLWWPATGWGTTFAEENEAAYLLQKASRVQSCWVALSQYQKKNKNAINVCGLLALHIGLQGFPYRTASTACPEESAISSLSYHEDVVHWTVFCRLFPEKAIWGYIYCMLDNGLSEPPSSSSLCWLVQKQSTEF